MLNVLLLESQDFPLEAISKMESIGLRVHLSLNTISTHEVDILFIRLANYIGYEFLNLYPRLCYLVSPTTGLTHIDKLALQSRSVHLISLQGDYHFLSNIYATAEHTLCLMLALMRRLVISHFSVCSGTWDRTKYKGSELHGKTVLIIGYGRVGRQLIQLLQPFNCHLLVHDVQATKVPQYLRPYSLHEMLKIADIVSLHVNYNEQNHHFFDTTLIGLLKRSALFINTSRGELVDHEFLIKALRHNLFAGAAIDVLEDEPSPNLSFLIDNSDLLDSGRLLVTPHVAGYTHESLSKVENYVTSKLLDQLSIKV